MESKKIKKKYLKYTIKFLNYKKQLGGKPKTSATYDKLKKSFSILAEKTEPDETDPQFQIPVIKKYFVEYMKKNLDKLDELIDDNNKKIVDELDIDKINRLFLAKSFDDQIQPSRDFCIKKGIQPDNCLEALLLTKYRDEVGTSIADIVKESLEKRMNVERLKFIRQIYDNKIDDFFKNTDIKKYVDEIFKYCDANNSPPFNMYKQELLEYLFTILSGTYDLEGAPFNIIITGTPGVGKSFIARQIAQLLKLTNLLPIGSLINIKKPDVIGQYIGQTAPKTYKMLGSGIGNVVFIDEAYSYAGKRTQHGFDPFGKEFIDALVEFASEHAGLISIIAAGYKKEMDEQFMEVNSGMGRRFTVKLELSRYKPDKIIDSFKNTINLPSSIPNSLSSRPFKTFYENINLDEIYNLSSLPPGSNLFEYFTRSLYYSFKDFLLYIQYNKNDEEYTDTDNFLLDELVLCNKFNPIYNFKINEKTYTIINDENPITKMLIAYLMENCGIKYGDLLNNQMSDIIILKDLILTGVTTNSDNYDLTLKNIYSSYITQKSGLDIDKDYSINIKDESIPSNSATFYKKCTISFNIKGINKSRILKFLEKYDKVKSQQDTLYDKITTIPKTRDVPDLINFLIDVCDHLTDVIEKNSDYSLFTLDEIIDNKNNLIEIRDKPYDVDSLTNHLATTSFK